MKPFKTSLAASALALTTAFAANAQDGLLPYSVTQECALNAMEDTYGGPLFIDQDENGVIGVSREITNPSTAVKSKIFGFVFKDKSGQIQSVKTFLVIEEKGNLNFNASSTFDYQTGKGVKISIPENPNLNPAATVANSFTKEVDDRMRQCERSLLLTGSPPPLNLG